MATVTKVFNRVDLHNLDEHVLSKARAVVPMREVDQYGILTIGMRHDVDHDLEAALRMAEWEQERGYRATYFLLHTAEYWSDQVMHDGDVSQYRAPVWHPPHDRVFTAVERFVELGHEVGFHNNALIASIETGADVFDIIEWEVQWLREVADVVGVAAHGDPRCYRQIDGVKTCVLTNYEMWEGTFRRGEDGEPVIRTPYLRRPLSHYGFEYESFWKPRAHLISDSGGEWHGYDDAPISDWPTEAGQLHCLIHADWWKL